VPHSGTGELAGLHGEGEMNLSGHAESYPMTFRYTFE
jgi:hypothetical protein